MRENISKVESIVFGVKFIFLKLNLIMRIKMYDKFQN